MQRMEEWGDLVCKTGEHAPSNLASLLKPPGLSPYFPKFAGRIPLWGNRTCALHLVGSACSIKSTAIEIISCLIYCKLVPLPAFTI